jgi:uncharacterized RDD family membrane protein YckC
VSPPAELAGLTRRLLSLLYEIPLLAAVLIAGSLPLPALSSGAQDIVARDGGPLGVRQAIYRYILALGGTLLAGAGFLWALADREGQFLHDRLAGTRIVNCRVLNIEF